MGPLWLGQGTVPHCTVSDLLSTDVLVSPPGAPVGAGETTNFFININYYNHYIIPSVRVLIKEVTVLLIPIPSYTATTLIVQLLPEAREEMVLVVILEAVTDSVSHNS